MSRLISHGVCFQCRLQENFIARAQHGKALSLIDEQRRDLKKRLEFRLAKANRGIFGLKVISPQLAGQRQLELQAAEKEDILGLLSRLEAVNPNPQPTRNLFLADGEWTLLFSTITITGSRRTKLGLREFVTLGEFRQVIDTERQIAVINRSSLHKG